MKVLPKPSRSKNNNSNDVFCILIKNIGSGSIKAKAYLQLTYEETIDQLRAFGLTPEEDFILRKISPGYGIPKEGELMLFEIIRSKWKDIDWLDCDLDYRTMMSKQMTLGTGLEVFLDQAVEGGASGRRRW